MSIDLTLRAIPDAALEAVFCEYWPAYRRWIRRAPTDRDAWRLALREHMPELEPVHARLVERFGGSDEVARFLSLWSPPPVVRGCTQLVLDSDDGPRLLRVYDHHPRLFDGLLLQSRWLSRATLAMTDCLWGALDGLNSDGLAIALAFGGRKEVAPGFAAPLICRHVLETCATVGEATRVLRRTPAYMAYTFVVVDAHGAFTTAFLGPGRPAVFVDDRASTNHQGTIEWGRYDEFAKSSVRLERARTLASGRIDPATARRAMLAPPLWRDGYAAASGSLYMAEYAPASRTMHLHWPDRSETFGIEQFQSRTIRVKLAANSGP